MERFLRLNYFVCSDSMLVAVPPAAAAGCCARRKMASSVQVLCPNGRRQNVKVTANTKLLQVNVFREIRLL